MYAWVYISIVNTYYIHGLLGKSPIILNISRTGCAALMQFCIQRGPYSTCINRSSFLWLYISILIRIYTCMSKYVRIYKMDSPINLNVCLIVQSKM